MKPRSFQVSNHRPSARRALNVRQCRPNSEALEPRITLDSGVGQATSAALPDGVDSMALGDFNGDRVLDLVVAGRENGHYVVTIYDGDGEASTATSTGATAKVLWTETDPLGAGVGPIDVTAGDFAGTGLSDLAMSSMSSANGGGSKIQILSFALTSGSGSPVHADVTSTAISPIFTPDGFDGADGLEVAAGDFDDNGHDELMVGSAGSGPAQLEELGYLGGQVWNVEQTITQAPFDLKGGVSLAAGDLTGDGTAELAVGSKEGSVSAYNFVTKTWSKVITPLGANAGPLRLAVVANENAPGALAVTSTTSTGRKSAAMVLWKTNRVVDFKLTTSPGSGTLVPLGGGWLYPRSSIKMQKGTTSFPYSNGPVNAAVVFGSTGGSTVVIQDFKPTMVLNKADTYVEPILSQATSSAAFLPIQDATSATPPDGTASKVPQLLAYPAIVYHSPYKILLPDSSVLNGLPGNSPISAAKPILWGPVTGAVSSPTIPTGDGNDWLRQRVLAAYSQLIGDAYQHHHDPRWLPTQGSPWNVATLGYQSQGVDCTNLTAYAYKVALGISLNATTPVQAAISPTNTSNIQIPSAIASHVQLKVLPGSTDYKTFVSELEPGDILYINPTMKTGAPSDPSKVTHAITWLGQYGVDKNGKDPYLIIDSTGKNPAHIDSNNQVVTPGIEIRPFGSPGSQNDWYFLHVDHVLRIIAS